MKKENIKLFKSGDFLFLFILILAGYFVWNFVTGAETNISTAYIQINDEIEYQIDLNQAQKIGLNEFNPSVEVEVKNGSIAITMNDCLHKICMKMGSISRGGQSIICVPKKILIFLPAKSHEVNTIKAITG
jgi:hypothetical protein